MELPFVPLLNRQQPPFEVFSGIVDTDTYQSLIHFPFVATAPDGVHVLERGTPLVQVIAFQRRSSDLAAVVRAESDEEKLQRTRITRSTQSSEGWYRETARAKR